ncbi:hypothetical protein [Blastococcus sp. KM273129]|uniref:hypothetical protein n=1 Tax=Blastococcus sp. KM273129 TaxID=2570315 RepID=UPI001F401D8B|nr:hypothetical protein [Blastococcus sp. KM273129]
MRAQDPGVQAAGGGQLLVRAGLGDPAGVEDRHEVGGRQRGQPGGDQQDRRLVLDRRLRTDGGPQRVHDPRLGAQVEGGERVVEDEQPRPGERGCERAGQRDPLALPA